MTGSGAFPGRKQCGLSISSEYGLLLLPVYRHIAHAAKGHGQGNNIQPGCLVAYNRGEKQDGLGLVLEPHGKKNWWLQDEVRRCSSGVVDQQSAIAC